MHALEITYFDSIPIMHLFTSNVKRMLKNILCIHSYENQKQNDTSEDK